MVRCNRLCLHSFDSALSCIPYSYSMICVYAPRAQISYLCLGAAVFFLSPCLNKCHHLLTTISYPFCIIAFKPIIDASVQDLVQAYLDHATVSRKLPGEGHEWSIEYFADALNVFVSMNQPVTIPQPTISATDSATGDSSTMSQLFSRMDRVLILNAEYKKAMCEARKAKR